MGSPQVEWRSCDVTDSPSFRNALIELDDQLGGATYFVANAGIGGTAKIKTDSFDVIKKCLMINVLAAIEGIELMKERMILRGRGVLVGMSSVAGTRGLPDPAGYSASKAALTTYLESLRVLLQKSGVQVITVAPGFISTELTKRNAGRMPFIMPVDRAAEIFVKKVIQKQRFIVAPWQYAWAIWILKLLPVFIYDGLIRVSFGYVRGTKRPQ
jgi:short-subunit dehydrogenase